MRALPGLAAVILLLFSLAPTAIVFLDQKAPADAHVQELSGPWKVNYQPPEHAEQPSVDDQRWEQVSFPADYAARHVPTSHFFLRRRVTFGPELAGQRLFLTVGDLTSAAMRVWVDGRLAGDIGDFERGSVGDFAHWMGTEIPAELATPGEHVLALETHAVIPEFAMGSDQRIWLGRATPLSAFHRFSSDLEDFLRQGPVLVALFLSLLLVCVVVLGKDGDEASGARESVAMALGCGLYVVAETGIFFGAHAAQGRLNLMMFAIPFISVGACELLEHAFVGRVTWIRWFIRVSGVFIAVYSFVDQAFFGHRMTNLEAVQANWSLGTGIYLMILPLIGLYRAARGRPPTYPVLGTLVIAISTLIYDLAGLADALTDLGVVSFPRVLAVNMMNTPVLSGIVVLTNFLGIYRRNQELARSLTERNAALVVALEEAQEADRVKGEFVASISHELRTPLNSIINIPEGLLEDFPVRDGGRVFSGDAEDAVRYLDMLRRNGTHLLGVVNQLLDFSKLQAGKTVLQRQDVPLRPLCEEVLSLTHEAFARKGNVKLELAGAKDASLNADPVKLTQVLLNLTTNAVKFSPEGATVTLTLTDEPEGVLFAVRDHGIGISPQNHELIFQMFRQVEGGSTRRFGGTGLGLPIARQLVELHGGKLWVESEPGHGATFLFRIPKQAEIAPAAGAA